MSGEQLFELGAPGPLRDRLVAAVLAGEKVATSSLRLQYDDEGEPLPTAGERRVLVEVVVERFRVVRVLIGETRRPPHV
jgi:uncharacterized protein YhfF